MPRIAGFNIIDCAIKNRDILYFLVREDYTQRLDWKDGRDAPAETKLLKRILSLNLQKPAGQNWGIGQIGGFGRSFCDVAFTPDAKIVVLDIASNSWTPTAGSDGFEPSIPSKFEGGIRLGALSRAKSFGGDLFAASTARQLFVRRQPGVWELLGNPLPKPEENKLSFVDFDGFNDGDVYAVGDAGDVWHLQGKTWGRRKFPSNAGLSAVCCGGDGLVYVAAGNIIYRGVGDKWEKLKTVAPISLPIKDLVWYDSELWATNDYGVWVLRENKLDEAEVPSGVKVCAGNLAVRDGVLLIAGYGGAAFKFNGKWTEIFNDVEVRGWFQGNRDKVWKLSK
jgi:hypothetical protein